jgi:drug/metabolite transporter (DMT)-like permease
MVTIADSSEATAAGDHSLLGDALCVGSAMCYSCYTVMMQRELKEDDPDVPALFFGYVGVLVAVLGAPVVLALHWTGVYDLTALNSTAVGLAFLNGEGCQVSAASLQHDSLCPALCLSTSMGEMQQC